MLWTVVQAACHMRHLLRSAGVCPQYVFALTAPSETAQGGEVWRSEDYGKTWSDITGLLAGACLGARPAQCK